MVQRTSLKRLALLFLLVLGLALPVVAFAQEAGSHSETTTETGAAAETGAASEAPKAESTSPLTPLGINTGFLVAQIVNFLLIFLLLYFALWRPIKNMLDGRSMKIQKGLEDAAAAAAARRNAEAEAEKILAAARADAARVIEEARGRGEEVAKQVEAEARTEADRIREEARARANEERDRQLADLRSQVIQIAVAMSQRLIGETLTQKRQQALVNDFFAKVPADARVLSGNLEVVSAMPLTDEEKAKVASELGAELINYSVDPSILGGLVIRSQDRVVDASVRTNLSDLAGRLR